MTLTLERAIRHVKHALGRDTDPDLNPVEIVNVAGQHLVSMFEWSWLERPAVELDLVASQNYVDLPLDFGKAISVQVNSQISKFTWTPLSDILRKRASDLSVSGLQYWGGIEYSSPTSSAAPTPRLALWPTPASSVTDGLLLYYRAKWPGVTNDSYLVPVPDFIEPLMLELIRAFAIGWEESESASVGEMVARVEAGPIALAAMTNDQGTQWDFGRVEGGAAASFMDSTRGANLSPWNLSIP